MHNLGTFKSLYKEEAALSIDSAKRETPNLDDIKDGFPAMVAAAGLSLSDITFAYVSGSYSRHRQTPFSDIDIECFSPVEKEIQDTFKWRGRLVSFSVYPVGSVRGEGDNIMDNSWARSCFKDAYPIYDPKGEFETCKRNLLANDDLGLSDDELSFGKNMRKVIEYRRKLLSALQPECRSSIIIQAFAASRFLETYVVTKNILVNGTISSEKGQFDVLDQATSAYPLGLQQNAVKLFSPELKLEDAIALTAPFFSDLQAIIEANFVETRSLLANESRPQPRVFARRMP